MYQYMPDYASSVSIPDLPGFDAFLGQVKGQMGESGITTIS